MVLGLFEVVFLTKFLQNYFHGSFETLLGLKAQKNPHGMCTKLKKKQKKTNFHHSDRIGSDYRFGSDRIKWIGLDRIGSNKLEWIGLDRIENLIILRIRIGYGYEIWKTDWFGWIRGRMLAYGSDTDRIGYSFSYV